MARPLLQAVLLFLVGALGVFALAPLQLFPLAWLALAALFAAWRQHPGCWRAALQGFAWGLGYFLASIHWVYISLHTYGGMPAWLALLCTGLFAAYLALFPALAGWLSTSLLARRPGAASLLLGMPALFVLADVLRGWLFTGFPWAAIGYSQLPVLGGWLPILGSHGLTLLLALAVAVTLWRWRAGALLAGALLLAGLGLQQLRFTQPVGGPVSVSLLQGNIPQDIKWVRENYVQSLRVYHEQLGRAQGQLIVLPETAFPAFLEQTPPEYLDELRRMARSKQTQVLFGIAISGSQPGEYYNGVVRLDQPQLTPYRKSHLVPFGEYVPMPALFGWMYRFMSIPLDGFTAGLDPQAPFALAGGSVAANVCYEDIFGHEFRVNAANATLLANVSNLAWFDGSWAAEQQLQMAQARVLENGRELVRATNTGATAVIGIDGRIRDRLPLQTRGVLESRVWHYTGATPYQRWGDAAIWGLLAVFIGVSCFGFRKTKHED
ncbi:apolipoprotein N-acyltransferase [Chitinilyticum piscinae]|uniref:Apolipoprotein N-acyltransferase n=1 Tax=Chitinilyticum piscinae TaxID=2866724 RepID=A0A8J7FJ44_9NEIS|nr:apolipoprotein N-acyltransferase [Chitinilyticum piscinae]MBE9608412.1 apolipoprotein N-acyltransferase [Chitinilyticum piscinae]